MNKNKDAIITAVLDSFTGRLQECSEKEILGFGSFGNVYLCSDPIHKAALSRVGDSFTKMQINSSQDYNSDSE